VKPSNVDEHIAIK